MVRSSPQSGHESFFLSIETMELLLLVPQWNYSMGQTLRWNYSTGNSQSLASNPREDKWNGEEKVAEFPSVCETRPVLCQNMAPRVNTSIRDDCKPSFTFFMSVLAENRDGVPFAFCLPPVMRSYWQSECKWLLQPSQSICSSIQLFPLASGFIAIYLHPEKAAMCGSAMSPYISG